MIFLWGWYSSNRIIWWTLTQWQKDPGDFPIENNCLRRATISTGERSTSPGVYIPVFRQSISGGDTLQKRILILVDVISNPHFGWFTVTSKCVDCWSNHHLLSHLVSCLNHISKSDHTKSHLRAPLLGALEKLLYQSFGLVTSASVNFVKPLCIMYVYIYIYLFIYVLYIDCM